MLSPSRRGLKRKVLSLSVYSAQCPYNAVPIAKGTETSQNSIMADLVSCSYNAVPIAKGTETWSQDCAQVNRRIMLQCCPHREGD